MENIFALNNQVFGLNFRERRVSSKTRRAMRSEFVTPANSVEMTYDDVCDVNGGGSVYFSNAELGGFIFGTLTAYSEANKAMLASGSTLAGILISGVLASYKIGLLAMIPVGGWIAVGIIAAAVVATAATIIVAYCQGKGIKIWCDAYWNWGPHVSAGISFE